MVFRSFNTNCVLRIILLVLNAVVFAFLTVKTSLYATMAVAAICLVIQSWMLLRFVDRSNRDWSRFLSAVRYSDFTSGFSDTGESGSHNELRSAFQSVLDSFRKVRASREEHLRYLQRVMIHIDVGIIVYDNTGAVDVSNKAFQRMFNVSEIEHVDDLHVISEEIASHVKTVQSGNRQLVKIERGGKLLQIAVHATQFKLSGRMLKLVSLQDITNELAEQEMESWQQLVRVLTHEIINSVTPIASLASSVGTLIGSRGDRRDLQLSATDAQDLNEAAVTIEKRSKGLIGFVQSYRQLTRLPRPDFRLVKVEDMFRRITTLMSHQIESEQIEVSSSVNPESLGIVVDISLMEQVLINLMVNAIQALNGRSNARISLAARMKSGGGVLITVADNGRGIENESLESIFVPFYTTKPDGTGIGLSLARQIMRMHGGEITVNSNVGSGASFSLAL